MALYMIRVSPDNEEPRYHKAGRPCTIRVYHSRNSVNHAMRYVKKRYPHAYPVKIKKVEKDS